MEAISHTAWLWSYRIFPGKPDPPQIQQKAYSLINRGYDDQIIPGYEEVELTYESDIRRNVTPAAPVIKM